MLAVKADKRQTLWDRVQGEVGVPVPKEHKKDKAEWLKPGLVGRVRRSKSEEKLRHARLPDFWEDNQRARSVLGILYDCYPSGGRHGTLILVELGLCYGTALSIRPNERFISDDRGPL
ncbi:hypothetical protein X751_00215 [Mesorhizobium sp. LNJC395A00]|nr:hypothetical protein X751_00215 [Mesorhizobium sp. LNJC395A00]